MEPTCSKCGGKAFAATVMRVRNWADKVTFFHCDTCGAIVTGTYFETPEMLAALTTDVLPPRTKPPRR